MDSLLSELPGKNECKEGVCKKEVQQYQQLYKSIKHMKLSNRKIDGDTENLSLREDLWDTAGQFQNEERRKGILANQRYYRTEPGSVHLEPACQVEKKSH